jgi:hypothetical protein
MFVSDQCLCPVSIGAARARLVNLAHGGWLGGASAAAYQDGLDQLLRVGPFGDVPGLSRPVQAHFLDPVDRDGSVTMAMRWEATGLTGRLFPALDANITLTPEGGQATRITLTGVYRSPLGALGAGLERALLHHVATATIGSLLTRMNEALGGPCPGTRQGGRARLVAAWAADGPRAHAHADLRGTGPRLVRSNKAGAAALAATVPLAVGADASCRGHVLGLPCGGVSGASAGCWPGAAGAALGRDDHQTFWAGPFDPAAAPLPGT